MEYIKVKKPFECVGDNNALFLALLVVNKFGACGLNIHFNMSKYIKGLRRPEGLNPI